MEAQRVILHPRWNFQFIVLSYLISVLGSFTCLAAISQARHTRKRLHVLLWIIAASLIFGLIAVWAMHFAGMMSFHLNYSDGGNVSMKYDAVITLLSMCCDTLGAFFGFMVTSVQRLLKCQYHEAVAHIVECVRTSSIVQRLLPMQAPYELLPANDLFLQHHSNIEEAVQMESEPRKRALDEYQKFFSDQSDSENDQEERDDDHYNCYRHLPPLGLLRRNCESNSIETTTIEPYGNDHDWTASHMNSATRAPRTSTDR